MKKQIGIVIKSFIVLILIIITLDLITSYIRYHNYYNQESIHHPSLESVHSEYSVVYLDQSTYKMIDFNGKVKVLYWHSGCPASKRWLPRLNRIASENADSVEVFLITEQSPQSLENVINFKNIHLCTGAGRIDENTFKHSSSSHIVILDKHNILKAYGYQLDESDSIIKILANNRSLSPSLSERIGLLENEFQIMMQNHNNLNFIVTGFDENRNSSSSRTSINWVNFVNEPIGLIYASTFRIPEYRTIDLTGGNIKSDNTSNRYCVYFKTKTSFAPYAWQMFFDDKEKRRQIFVADIHKRLDKEFGLKSDIVLRTGPTLILKKVIPNQKTEFKRLPRNEEYVYDISTDVDSVRWNYNLKTNIWSIINTIERVLKMPVRTDYASSDKYHIIFNVLNNKMFTQEEIIEDLRSQGFLLDIENREVEYLEIKKCSR